MLVTKISIYMMMLLFFITSCFFASQIIYALPGYKPAEKYVIKQLTDGQVADLEEKFPDTLERVISTTFLEKLLTNSLKDVKVHRNGVRITNAVFIEKINLKNAEIPFEVRLENCHFKDSVDISCTFFSKDLSFWGSTFDSDFFGDNMKVGSNAFFNDATFAGPVSLYGADISCQFSATGAWFTDSTSEAKFNSMKVGNTAFLIKAVFIGAVSFYGADIKAHFVADSITFMNTSSGADFSDMKVGGSVFFKSATFTGPVEFVVSDIAGQFNATDARFTNTISGVNFNGMKVGDITFFTSATFRGPVSFVGADIAGEFNATGAKFTDTISKANFGSMKVGDVAFFTSVTFAGPVNFKYAEIAGNFEFDSVKFTGFNKEVSFDAMKVGNTAFFRNAVFRGPVSFVGADIAGQFNANDAKFMATEYGVNFNGIKVGDIAFFEYDTFAGPVSFAGADIAGEFNATGAKFTDTISGANFSGMKVGSDAILEDATFAGPVEFADADIKGQLKAELTSFSQEVNFSSIKVGGDAFFEGAIFRGPVSFKYAEVVSNFVSNYAKFTNINEGASFDVMKVGNNAFFRFAAFTGSVRFISADIKGQLQANYVNFAQEVNFSNIKVGDIAFFQYATFVGPVYMRDASFFNLEIKGNKNEKAETCPSLDLSRTIIRNELRIEDIILKSLITTSIHVAGPAFLNKLTITDTLNLEHSDFLTLEFGDSLSFPKNSENIRFEGMTYQHINAGSEKDSWKKLKDLINSSKFSVSVYANLENFFRQQGYDDRADAVFFAMKEREQKEILRGALQFWNVFSLFWNFLLKILVRYGRSPGLIFLWSIIPVVFGCIVFRRKNMMLQDPKDTSQNYNTLWYSLDLFTPFINMQAADIWMPRPERRFARHYMRVHRILGWILIPIGLAAITGIIK